MHLAVVSPFPPAITGVGQYGYHVTRALAKSGLFDRLTVLAGAPKGAQPPNHLGHTEIDYCWEPQRLGARDSILSRLDRLDPDLVWFNVGASMFGRSPLANLSGSLAPLLARRMGFPTVVTLHELVELADLRALNAPGGPFAAAGARLLTSLTTNADVVCLTMQQYVNWLAPRRADCIHIPIGAYHEPELLEETQEPELLFFTTLAPYKGLELLLEAFPNLLASHPNLRLTIAGAEHARFPEYKRELRARFNGMAGVRWAGQVDEDNVKELFRRAQIIVLPYAASTGSSSVLYQAATWGRPVVASNVHEIRTLVTENDLQVELFENGDVLSLSRAVSALADSPARRRAQARHNFAAIQRARPEETCRQYIAAFNRALEKRRSPVRIPAATKIQLA